MGNAASGNIAILYGLRGPNICVVSACASASHAIGEAFLQYYQRQKRHYHNRRLRGGAYSDRTGVVLCGKVAESEK